MSRLVTATPISPPSQGWMSLAKVVPSSPWDWSSVLNSACTCAQPGKRPATSFSFVPGVGAGVDVRADEDERVGRDGLGRLAVGAGRAGAATASVVGAAAGRDERGRDEHEEEAEKVSSSLQQGT